MINARRFHLDCQDVTIECIGLKLQPLSDPVNVVLIDLVERPTD